MTEQEIPVLDTERALALLDAAVADRGADYIYTPPWGEAVVNGDGTLCLYWHRSAVDSSDAGQPGCIAGHVYHAAGVSGEWLSRNERIDATTVGQRLNDTTILAVTEGARYILNVAQSEQDAGVPWGEAVAYARLIAESYSSNTAD